jgi:hypothetical protein
MKNYNTLARDKPAGVILYQSPLYPERRSTHHDKTQKRSDHSPANNRKWERTPDRWTRPFKGIGDNDPEGPEKDERHNDTERPTPGEGVPDMDRPIGTFARPSRSPVSLPPQ